METKKAKPRKRLSRDKILDAFSTKALGAVRGQIGGRPFNASRGSGAFGCTSGR